MLLPAEPLSYPYGVQLFDPESGVTTRTVGDIFTVTPTTKESGRRWAIFARMTQSGSDPANGELLLEARGDGGTTWIPLSIASTDAAGTWGAAVQIPMLRQVRAVADPREGATLSATVELRCTHAFTATSTPSPPDEGI